MNSFLLMLFICNEIGVKGAEMVAEALKTNHSITYLDLELILKIYHFLI